LLSLERTFKSASLKRVALRDGIQGGLRAPFSFTRQDHHSGQLTPFRRLDENGRLDRESPPTGRRCEMANPPGAARRRSEKGGGGHIRNREYVDVVNSLKR
jgi:hypothetical protein